MPKTRQGRGWRAGHHKPVVTCISCGRRATTNVIDTLGGSFKEELYGEYRYWRKPPETRRYWDHMWPDWLPRHVGLCKGGCKRWQAIEDRRAARVEAAAARQREAMGA